MIDIGVDELYELASAAKSDPYGHPYEQVLDNFGNFRCLMTPSLIIWLIDSLREAERDAARYQWLRESASLENHGGFEYDLPLIHAVRYMDGAELNQEMTFDEAIDQAMKEKGDE